MARVITVDLNDEVMAYPYKALQERPAINDTVGGVPTAVFWPPGTTSALDSSAIASDRDVGTANTFFRELDGQTLTFRIDGDKITDEQTGSEWNILGQTVCSKLAGCQLEPVVICQPLLVLVGGLQVGDSHLSTVAKSFPPWKKCCLAQPSIDAGCG